MKKPWALKLVGAVIAVTMIVTPAFAAKQKPIRVGLLYALSGLAAVYTKGTVIGHEIAAEEINAKGGVLGRPIEYVVRDNKLKPGIAVKEFRRMVTRDKVDFIMGIISSGVALAVSQVAKEMQFPFIDVIAQTATLTGEQGHRYVVRTNTNTTVQARAAALAASRGPWKTFYLIGPDYEYGHRVNDDFWSYLQQNKEGVVKLGELWPKLGERDFSAHITTILNAKPDAVFGSIWGGDVIAFIKQAKAYGFFDKVQFMSAAIGDLDILKPLGEEAPDGILTTFLYAFDMPVKGKEKENEAFVAKYKKRAGYEPKSGDITGYIATYILADAIERAGSTDHEAVLDQLRGGVFDTLLGKITIRDFDGQATFGYHTGVTYTNPDFPYKRLKDVTYYKGEDVLRSKEEVERDRKAYEAKGH